VGIAGLVPTRCAICGTTENAIELYPASLRDADLNPTIFSARRSPDRVHYRMVRCRSCALVRSDPIADPGNLGALYQQSGFDYSQEVDNLRATYGHFLAKLAVRAGGGEKMPSLLEIGCGNGFALVEARLRGFHTVRGVEPSTEAVSKAALDVRAAILCDMMRPGLLEAEQFDSVCLFQMFDHVPDPGGLLHECWTVLKPGGHILILNHNVEAFSARVLRERSPIVDIEHTYLYSPATLSRVCVANGFAVRESGRVWNRVRVEYLAHLAPLPPMLRRAARRTCDSTGIGRIKLALPLGNLYLIGQKLPISGRQESPDHGLRKEP
jgi:SAM-dependent methyltransferase